MKPPYKQDVSTTDTLFLTGNGGNQPRGRPGGNGWPEMYLDQSICTGIQPLLAIVSSVQESIYQVQFSWTPAETEALPRGMRLSRQLPQLQSRPALRYYCTAPFHGNILVWEIGRLDVSSFIVFLCSQVVTAARSYFGNLRKQYVLFLFLSPSALAIDCPYGRLYVLHGPALHPDGKDEVTFNRQLMQLTCSTAYIWSAN